MNVMLAGEEAAGMRLLHSLLRGPDSLLGVLTTPPDVEAPMSIWKVAEKAGVQVWPSRLVTDSGFADVMREAKVDLFLNIHSLYIVHPDVVAAPRIGSYNLHPGLLPEYAGLNSASWAIYRGEPLMGVTLHRMEAGIDTGPIAYQTTFPIGDKDTALTVNARCVREGLQQTSQLLDAARTDPKAIPAIAQEWSRRGYFGREVPRDGRLEWTRSAEAVLRFVRACDYGPFPSPWGHPRTRCYDRELGIAKAGATGEPCTSAPGTVAAHGEGVRVACADEWIDVKLVSIDGEFRNAAEVLQPGDELAEPILPQS